LWQTDIPGGDREKHAKTLFCYENPPGTREFSGSQDALGIVLPGLNRLDYRGGYWPAKITSVEDEETLRWLETHLHLVPLGPRQSGFQVLKGTRITPAKVRALASAADHCWDAIRKRDLVEFGRHFRESFEAQVGMFPNMANSNVRSTIALYAEKSLGWKLSGAGGGGYLVLVGRHDIRGAIKIKIRRKGQ
jgi:galactokinase/mevalonate kinase-like predicted kinase